MIHGFRIQEGGCQSFSYSQAIDSLIHKIFKKIITVKGIFGNFLNILAIQWCLFSKWGILGDIYAVFLGG